MAHTTNNYYSYATTTPEEFYNNVVVNYINKAKKDGEHSTRVTVWNLTVSKFELMQIVKANGYKVLGIRRAPRSFQIDW